MLLQGKCLTRMGQKDNYRDGSSFDLLPFFRFFMIIEIYVLGFLNFVKYAHC